MGRIPVAGQHNVPLCGVRRMTEPIHPCHPLTRSPQHLSPLCATFPMPPVGAGGTVPRRPKPPSDVASAGLTARGANFELDSARRPAKAGVPSLEARHARCCLLAAEGELSRACAALVEPTPLPPSAETFTQLQDKHPQAALPDPALLGPPHPAAVPEFEALLLALCAVLSALRPQAPLACARTLARGPANCARR